MGTIDILRERFPGMQISTRRSRGVSLIRVAPREHGSFVRPRRESRACTKCLLYAPSIRGQFTRTAMITSAYSRKRAFDRFVVDSSMCARCVHGVRRCPKERTSRTSASKSRIDQPFRYSISLLICRTFAASGSARENASSRANPLAIFIVSRHDDAVHPASRFGDLTCTRGYRARVQQTSSR